MKKTTKTKKLKLNKATIRTLSEMDLTDIVGGTSERCCPAPPPIVVPV